MTQNRKPVAIMILSIFSAVSAAVAVDGFVPGLIGLILSIKQKRKNLIWLPILGMAGSIIAVVFVGVAFPAA